MNSMSDAGISRMILRKTYEDIEKGEHLLSTVVEAFCEAIYLDLDLWRKPNACAEAEAAKTDLQVAQAVGATAQPLARREAIAVAIQSVRRRIEHVESLRPRYIFHEERPSKSPYDQLGAYINTATEWANSGDGLTP